MQLRYGLVVVALAGLAACESDKNNDRNDRYDQSARSSDTRSDDMSNSSSRIGANAPAARVLSFLHKTNTEEIEMGRLAQQNGGSDAVREYGRMLVQNHQDSENQVQSLARELNITLSDSNRSGSGNSMSGNNASGSNMSGNSNNTGPGSTTMMGGNNGMSDQPQSRLSSMRGAEFDRAFADEMVRGHRDAIDTVTRERDQVRNSRVRDLIDKTLPVLRDHLSRAQQLTRS